MKKTTLLAIALSAVMSNASPARVGPPIKKMASGSENAAALAKAMLNQ